MRRSLTPADYKPEDFAGREPHPLDAARIAQMRDFLSQAMKELGVPGVGFALLDGGKIVYERGLGVRQLGKPNAVDANTLFMAASNTKGMSTLLLSMLADDGKLRWDQPVSQLYPAFKLGSAEITSKVLVKHLVCACTGLPRQDMEWLFEFRDTSALDSMKLLGTNSPTSGFGELYQYNNLMASAAGYIGASLVHPEMELGKAYDKAMDERIFKPLGMNATTFVLLTNSDEGRQLLSPALRRLIEIMYDAKPEAAEDVRGAAERAAATRASAVKLITVPADPAIAGTLAKHYRSDELGDLPVRQNGKDLLLDAGEWKAKFVSRKNETRND